MGLLNFLNKDLKIHVQNKGPVKEFIINYPVKNGKFIEIGPSILWNVLKEGSIIIQIDTSLCFTDKVDSKTLIKKIKSRLNDLSLNFEYRIYKKDDTSRNPLSKLFEMSRKKSSQETLVFQLPQGFDDTMLLDDMLKLECHVFFTVENDDNPMLVQRVLNGHFDDDEERYENFRFVLFINSVISQAVIRTTHLDSKDIEKLCRH